MNWRKDLDTALAALDELHSSDCYGELYNGDSCPGPSDVEDESERRVDRCTACMATRATLAVVRALTPPLVPITPSRVTNPPERIYLELWREQNERHSSVNNGYTLLELLLCPEDATDPLTGRSRPKDWLTHRDAEVATTIVMWLGTNCGRAFLSNAELRIRQEQSEQSALDSYRVNRPGLWDENDPDKALAKRIADRFISIDQHANSALASAIAAALSLVRHGKTLEDLMESRSSSGKQAT